MGSAIIHMRRLWLLLIMLSCSSCSPVRTPSQSNAFPNLETESCNRLKSLYKKHGRPSAWMGNCDFVQWLVTRKRARVVVDLGVDYGFSTFAFASAMADDGARVTAIDLWTKHECQQDAVVAKLRDQLGLRARVELVIATFDDAFARYRALHAEGAFAIDVLHVDGTHAMPDVMYDYESWSSLLAPRGVVLFHDIRNTHVQWYFPSLPGRHFALGRGKHPAALGVLTNDTALYAEIQEQWEGAPIARVPYNFSAHPYGEKRLMTATTPQARQLGGCKSPGVGVNRSGVEYGVERQSLCFERDCLH